MAETKMQQVAAIEVEQKSAVSGVDVESLLEKFGGFAAVKGFIPSAADMNPAKKATKNIFLSEKKFESKRENLANELRGWLEILSVDKATPTEYASFCKEREQKYHKLLEDNVTTALDATRQLETAYRSLDLFFKNANSEKLTNLRLINVNREEINNDSSTLPNQIDQLLRDSYDRLSLKDSYSLLVIPGARADGTTQGTFQDKPTLLKWAKMAHKYKVMLLADHDKESTFDSLLEDTSNYKDSDIELQNVVMTGNWIAGRPIEQLSVDERESEEKAFFIPSAAALAGKLYDETANMAQGAGGKKYGTLTDVKGVEIDLLKTEIAALMDNQIVPMVYSEGRVMAFNNSTLYNGDNPAMREYPIVRVFDWVKKVLMNFVHDVALENWDPFTTPVQLKDKINKFLNEYQGYGNLFSDFTVEMPVQDPVTKVISVDVSLTPYFAAKNFSIKLSADKKDKKCEDL